MHNPSKKHILMIGPVYPYRGGISHYTGLMYRSLAKAHQVTMVSYKLQYPKFLFKKEQRDYDNDAFKIEGTDFLINTANPFNWVASARQIKRQKPDLVIIQWWHPYFAPCYWSICKLLGKRIPVLFLCHNVFPHERFPMDRFLSKLVLKRGSRFIVQSSTDEADLLSIRPQAVYKKTVHPTYNAFKLQDMTKAEGRAKLGLAPEEKVLLFFGFVREYKGLKHLLRAMPEVVAAQPDVKLLVVGEFAGDKQDYLDIIDEEGKRYAAATAQPAAAADTGDTDNAAAAAADTLSDHIAIYDNYIPDKEVEKFFAACDLVVLPYESATQSGIVQIAYGFEKPVIATNVGGLPDVVMDDKTGFIVESQDPKALAHSILRFFKEDKAAAFHDGIVAEAERYSWDRMAEIVQSLME